MLTAVSELHCAPTAWAARNLLGEGVPEDKVMVTGNTVIDALFLTLSEELCRRTGDEGDADGEPARRSVLITMHRREAWETAEPGRERGSVLDGILGAVRRAADRHPDVDFIYPVHLNPKVQDAARRAFGGARNARLIEPLPYVRFVKTM